MKVIVFEPDYDLKHSFILRAVAQGIPGAVVRPVTEYEPCDVAVIFGGVKKSYPKTWSKQAIVDQHAGRALLMVESAFVRRGEYYQIGWGGTAGAADFNLKPDMPMDRWEQIGGPMVKPWRRMDNQPIYVCGQLPRDVQVQDIDHRKWCRETVAYYMKKGTPVLFRPHPKIESAHDYGVLPFIINAQKLGSVLKSARAFITWNSTSAVDAVIAGVPVVALDKGSIAWPVAAHDLDTFDFMPEREPWFAGLGYSQWTLEECRAGLPWKHLNES